MKIPSEIVQWQMDAANAPLNARRIAPPPLGEEEVLIEIAGCGLCHTDLSFLFHGVKTRKALPLTLGHEMSGTVVAVGEHAARWLGKNVIVPSVIPCGQCDLCRAQRGTACRQQIMPGNDIHGGFASHAVMPSRYLCPVERDAIPLWQLGVVADAVTTPYQAMERAAVSVEDFVIVIGVGGIGGFAVQIAKTRNAQVMAIDIDDAKLERAKSFGAHQVVNIRDIDAKQLRELVRHEAKSLHVKPYGWKVFEMSGSAAGQALAYDLLTHAGTVAFVGFTMDKIPVRLGNLMAFDATIFGNWGCAPELYPQALDLVLEKRVLIEPFVERYPLEQINEVIDAAHRHALTKRPILVPTKS